MLLAPLMIFIVDVDCDVTTLRFELNPEICRKIDEVSFWTMKLGSRWTVLKITY